MQSIRSLDILIFIVFLATIVASVYITGGTHHGIRQIEVESTDSVYYLPLSEDRDLAVKGPVGNTLITVENGAAHVTHSDCRDKICMSMGKISQPSAWIACLPNKVFIRVIVRGENNEGAVDSGAY